MKTQVCMVFHVNSAPVRARGTCRFLRAGTDTSASERAAVFVGILYGVIPPWAHFMPGRTHKVRLVRALVLLKSRTKRIRDRRICA